jgi:hypothetical protein
MRQITVTLYRFDELSEEAQRRAWMNHAENLGEFGWNSEYLATLEAFEKAFDIEVKYSIDENAYYYEFVQNVEPPEMDWLRFARYIWNQYAHQIQRGKYYGKISKDGRHVFRHSKATVEYSCPFTGFMADMAITGPVWDCIHYKRQYNNYEDLMHDCLIEFFEEWRNDMEYDASFEAFEDLCSANEWEFYESGEMA